MITFDFSKEYILQNDVALLRPLSLDDVPKLLYVATEAEVWKYSTIKVNSGDDLHDYIAKAIENRIAGKEYPFVIIDKRTNEYAGCTRFYDIKLSQHSASLGYTWYAASHQGTGLNKNCKYLLFDFAFQTGFQRVEFAADTLNLRSIAAMKGIGCTEEGVLRSHIIRQDGTRRDTIILSMLQKEWSDRYREELQNKLK